MKIEVIDLRKRFQEEKKGILKCINRVLKKGNLVLTQEVQNFEKSICKFTGAKYCLGVNSGTDALLMSLWSSGISKNDEVITSPISFIASTSSIIHVGAKPVFVDVDDDLNINPDLIESAKSRWKQTLAIEINYTIENRNINCDLLLLFTEDSLKVLNDKIAYMME